jgi:spoIIIJ-associated protein
MIESNIKNQENTGEYNSLKKLIEEFLNKLTVKFESIEVQSGDVHPIFLIKSNDSGVLIGSNGENLRALNYLIKKMAEKNFPAPESQERMRFLLDVNGYHSRKIEELKNQAKILAERAKMFKSNVEMNPMNAYERMIIHATFSNDGEIETESEGFGKSRRVVLKYRANKDGAGMTDNELSSI